MGPRTHVESVPDGVRVLLVNDLEPGAGSGAEVHLDRLVRGLAGAGDAVELFAGTVRREGLAKGLDVWDPVAKRRLGQLIERFRPDVVHFHNVLRELSVSVLTAARPAARLLTVHDLRILGVPDGPVGMPFDRGLMRLVKRAKAGFDRSTARRTIDATIAPSRAVQSMVEAAGFRSVHYIPHFVEPGPEPATPPSASATVAFAGRLSPEKGAHLLVEAFAIATRGMDAGMLAVAGVGPQLPAIRAAAQRLPHDRWQMMGLLDGAGVRDLFGRSRVVVAPSLTREAAGLTVLEAAMAGRPSIVSDDPALRELVDEAEGGLVVPRGDVAALADAIRRLLVDPNAADRMGAAARRTAVATRTMASGIEATRAAYHTAIDRRRRREET